MQAKKTCAPESIVPQSTSAHETTINNRAVAQQTTRTNGVPSLRASPGLDLGIMARKPEQLPDPWLFDSEALLRELDRCREIVLQIPITNSNATHFGIHNWPSTQSTTSLKICATYCTCIGSNRAASDDNTKKLSRKHLQPQFRLSQK